MADGARPFAEPSTAPGAPALPAPRRFTRAEFDAMAEAGVFGEGERAELLGGVVYSMPGEGFPHADAVDQLADALSSVMPSGFALRVRTRLDLPEDGEVYPDILVQQAGVLGAQRGPATVPLIVEVSISSLTYDLTIKGERYANAGFPEFWVLEPAARRAGCIATPWPRGGGARCSKLGGKRPSPRCSRRAGP